MTQKNKKPKWDGKSRVSNDKYRKRFNEITWSNIDEVHKGLIRDKENYLIENLKWGTPSENNKGTSKRPDTMEQKYQNLVDKGIIKG